MKKLIILSLCIISSSICYADYEEDDLAIITKYSEEYQEIINENSICQETMEGERCREIAQEKYDSLTKRNFDDRIELLKYSPTTNYGESSDVYRNNI